jgi:RNA polymerase sigma factor (sigma-70 family)
MSLDQRAAKGKKPKRGVAPEFDESVFSSLPILVNSDTIRLIFFKYHSLLSLYVAGLVCAYDRARYLELPSDIVGEVFIRLWRNRKSLSFKSAAALQSYLRKSARNLTFNKIRDLMFEAETLEGYSFVAAAVEKEDEQAFIRSMLIEAVTEVIESLPAKQKAVIKMALDGKSTKQIASTMEVPVSIVWTNHSRAVKALRSHFHNPGQALTLIWILFFSR